MEKPIIGLMPNLTRKILQEMTLENQLECMRKLILKVTMYIEWF